MVLKNCQNGVKIAKKDGFFNSCETKMIKITVDRVKNTCFLKILFDYFSTIFC